MKKILLVTVLMPLLTLAQTNKGFTIKGNIKGLNAQVTLLSAIDNKVVATDNPVNGAFSLKDNQTILICSLSILQAVKNR